MYRIGSKCLIKKSNDIGGFPGAVGEIVDMEIQDNNLYQTFPLWIKILSGESKGSIRGFGYEEVAAGIDYLNPVAPFISVK